MNTYCIAYLYNLVGIFFGIAHPPEWIYPGFMKTFFRIRHELAVFEWDFLDQRQIFTKLIWIT